MTDAFILTVKNGVATVSKELAAQPQLAVKGMHLTTCKRTDEEGAQELEVTFSDPEFSAEQPAFYYARVLENPTCRWTTLLANSSDSELPADLPVTVQERGWSSPIWSASP